MIDFRAIASFSAELVCGFVGVWGLGASAEARLNPVGVFQGLPALPVSSLRIGADRQRPEARLPNRQRHRRSPNARSLRR